MSYVGVPQIGCALVLGCVIERCSMTKRSVFVLGNFVCIQQTVHVNALVCLHAKVTSLIAQLRHTMHDLWLSIRDGDHAYSTVSVLFVCGAAEPNTTCPWSSRHVARQGRPLCKCVWC